MRDRLLATPVTQTAKALCRKASYREEFPLRGEFALIMKSILFLMSRRRGRSNGYDWRSRWSRDDDWRSGYKGDDKPRYYRKKDDEYVILDFEGNDVPTGQSPAITNNRVFDTEYIEDGFVLSSQVSEGSNAPNAGVILLDTTYSTLPDFPQAESLGLAVNRVNQPPGRTVVNATESENDLVITRQDGEDFEFKGGYFAFAPILPSSTNTEANIKIIFEGYQNGKLVESFESRIPQGGFIKSRIDEDIDKLIIKDGDLAGWVVGDNLMFEI